MHSSALTPRNTTQEIVNTPRSDWAMMKEWRSDGEVINLLIAWYHFWWTLCFLAQPEITLGSYWSVLTFTLAVLHLLCYFRSTLAYAQFVAFAFSASWFAFMAYFNTRGMHTINAGPLYYGWTVTCLIMLYRRSQPMRRGGQSLHPSPSSSSRS